LTKNLTTINQFIDTYKDYPKKGIDFKDVLGIIQEPTIFKELILKMSSSEIIKNADAIISIDARGFIFGSAISLQASKPMLVARKPGKLPGELLEKNYSLEYGKNSLSIQKKALQKYNSYAIVDDLLATGGTVNCISKILKSVNKEVTGLLIVVELMKLEGRSSLDYPRDEKGYIDGLIHPERINQDWKMIKKGDPLFLDSKGKIHKYDGDHLIWPVFIGEVAYKEKKIAMIYTKKEVIFSKKQWVQEFESL